MLVKNIIVENDKIRLYPVDGRDEPIYGFVVDYDDNVISVALEDDLQKIAEETGERVILEVIKKEEKEESLYLAEAEVAKYIMDCIPCKLLVLTEFKRLQRRNYVRVPVQIELEYYVKGRELGEKGLIKDISGGGVLINTIEPLQVNSEINMRFYLEFPEEATVVHIPGMVVREDHVPRANADPEMPYKCGVIFEGLSAKEQDHIVKFVMMKVRERIRKMQLCRNNRINSTVC